MIAFCTTLNCMQADNIFSINLPSMLSNTIGRNDLRVEYSSFPGLGMMTVVDCLKCEGQCVGIMTSCSYLIILLSYLITLLYLIFRYDQIIYSFSDLFYYFPYRVVVRTDHLLYIYKEPVLPPMTTTQVSLLCLCLCLCLSPLFSLSSSKSSLSFCVLSPLWPVQLQHRLTLGLPMRS